MNGSQAKDAQAGQTIRFKRWATDRQRITVQVDKVETFGHTTIITGQRITKSGRNPGWTTAHRGQCFLTNPDTTIEIL